MYKLKETILKTRTVLMLLAVIFLAFSCKKEDVSLPDNSSYEWKTNNQQMPPSRSENHSNNGSTEDVAIVLGDTLSDPYKLENMQKAYNNINNGNAPISSVKANYRYVRVLPADQDELNAIEADTTLLLFDYPLHYEITVAGTYYHDPTVADSTMTWLYSVVPMNYQFPTGVNEELIYYVYIPPTESKGDFYDQLEEEAYRITGYEGEDNGSKAARGSWWTPSAKIRAWDDIVQGYIPLEGVKVLARFLTKTAKGITDGNGECEVDKDFRYPVYYSIKWESNVWDIRNGALGQAYYNVNTSMSTPWNFYIGNNGSSILYATVHRAAYKFCYGNRLGLKRPILSYGKTKIAVYDKTAWWGSGCCWGTWSLFGIIPDINIALPHSTCTAEVFGTTIHELGHQSHLLFIGKGTYIQLAKEIHESWAAAVECALTNHHYNNELSSYGTRCQQYNQGFSYQDWKPKDPPQKTNCYTPIFIDLIDNYNQRNGGNCGYYPIVSDSCPYSFSPNNNRPNDVISGYNITYIQNNVLPDAYGLSSLCSSLKAHKIAGVTDQMIDNHMAPYWNRIYTR